MHEYLFYINFLILLQQISFLTNKNLGIKDPEEFLLYL
jgi:hypothetical protein